jgi:hypothetical protein
MEVNFLCPYRPKFQSNVAIVMSLFLPGLFSRRSENRSGVSLFPSTFRAANEAHFLYRHDRVDHV